MNMDFERTTAAIVEAEQAHLTEMNRGVPWVRVGPLARLVRGEPRPSRVWGFLRRT